MKDIQVAAKNGASEIGYILLDKISINCDGYERWEVTEYENRIKVLDITT